MNSLSEIGGRALAVFIIVAFFFAIYAKIRHQTFRQSWDNIKDWVGAGKT